MKALRNRPNLSHKLEQKISNRQSEISSLQAEYDLETDIWKQKIIKDKALKIISNYWNKEIRDKLYNRGKRNWNSCPSCAYCELIIDTGFMNIEHFEPKSLNRILWLNWDNLLPTCSYCNTKKSNTDKSMINPSSHTYSFNYNFTYDNNDNLFLKWRNNDANNNINEIWLNDNRIIDRRKKYTEHIRNQIETAKRYSLDEKDLINDLCTNKFNNYEHWCDTFIDRLLENPNSPIHPFLT